MSQRGGFEGYHRPQVGATPSQHPQITMSGRVENPNAHALNQYAKAHQAGIGGAVGFPNPTAQGHLSTSSRDGQEEQATQSSVIDISGLPASAAGLLKQLLASMGGKAVIKDEAHAVESAPVKENECAILPEKGTELVESFVQGEARGLKIINKSYCQRCLSKGHVKEECVALLVCDICSSQTHLKPRCPLQNKASKVFAMTCGYAVDGLGFYYIPHQVSSKPKCDHNAAVIWVV
jgi:hypothetical protein